MSKNYSQNALENKIDLSIIVINYNTKKTTDLCLSSILTSLRYSKIAYEIVLIDNASTDGSVGFFSRLAEKEKAIKLFVNKTNLGYGRANNQGVNFAKGKYLLFLNSDTLILNRAIEKLFDYYQRNESEVAFLGVKLLNRDFTDQPSAAYFFTIPVVFAALFLKGDYWGLTRFSPGKVKKVDWVSGACFLTKKDIFRKVGGFDENIFMYMDEVDLLYRAKKMNYQTFFYPQPQIIHYGSLSSTKDKGYPIIKVYQGLFYFYKKHYSKFMLSLLKLLLKIKALLAIAVGKIFSRQNLVDTYKKALAITKEY
jgi:GT2 family glycosyltransferase